MLLKTKRLLIREFVENDWRAVQAYQSAPDYLRFYPWDHRTEMDVRAFIHMFMDWAHEQPRRKFQFAFVLAENGQLIGNGGLRMQNAYSRIADLGYELDQNYWGHGYATEAARGLLEFGFRELRLHRVWANCIEENIASAHVLEKLGMTREGCLRESEWMKNRWWNTPLYAILDHEWHALQK